MPSVKRLIGLAAARSDAAGARKNAATKIEVGTWKKGDFFIENPS